MIKRFRANMEKEKQHLELVKVLKSPTLFFDEIMTIESDMRRNIHSLVLEYGKKVKGNYVINTYNKHWGNYCLVTNSNGENVAIKQVVILNPESAQVMGHIILKGKDGEDYDFIRLTHQEFNVYSHLYHLIFNKISK